MKRNDDLGQEVSTQGGTLLLEREEPLRITEEELKEPGLAAVITINQAVLRWGTRAAGACWHSLTPLVTSKGTVPSHLRVAEPCVNCTSDSTEQEVIRAAGGDLVNGCS